MFRRGDKVVINGEVLSVWEDSNGHKVTVIGNTPLKDLLVFPEGMATLHTRVSDEEYAWLQKAIKESLPDTSKLEALASRPSPFV